ADFLGQGPGQLADARGFASRRRVAVGRPAMNRLYVVETDLTITGAKADHRLALRPRDIERFARALAAALELEDVQAPKLTGAMDAYIKEIAKELLEHRKQKKTTLVIAGDTQPPAVHALVHAINRHLDNVNQTVIYTAPLRTEPAPNLKERFL